MPLILCKDASFAYEGRVAVSGLNFAVHKGEYLCIVGENGSGKSTLVKGLLKLKAPASGSVELGDGLRANEIGYLPQQTAVQKDFPASVYEVVLSGRLSQRGILPFYSKQDKLTAAENMERLGIAALRRLCYRELSGGQQQRLLLARVFLRRSHVNVVSVNLSSDKLPKIYFFQGGFNEFSNIFQGRSFSQSSLVLAYGASSKSFIR